MTHPDGPAYSPLSDEPAFRDHLTRVAALVRSEHFVEAELEVLRALNLRPTDARALKLLALVRFKRGRYAEAREVYEMLARTMPEDAGVHLSLGLIALKMDWAEEAVAELEVAARLGASSTNLWTHLGYAYARLGRTDLAGEAFRRAGHEDLALEAEGGGLPGAAAAAPPEPSPLHAPSAEVQSADLAEASRAPSTPEVAAAAWPSGESGFFRPRSSGGEEVAPAQPVTTELEVEGFAPSRQQDSQATGELPASSLTSFVLGRLLDVPVAEEFTSPNSSLVGEVLRFSVAGPTHVRSSALLAATGALALSHARRRVRGQLAEENLVDGQGDFFLCDGQGELWLAPAAQQTRLLALTLEDDILYLRQTHVVAFDHGLTWEAGRLPGDRLPLLQLRGTGRAVLDVGQERFRAFKLPADRPLWVERGRLLGWVGRVVARVVTPAQQMGAGRGALVACEGEGVLLVSVYGVLDQPTDERAQHGHDGSGIADPGRAAVIG